MWSIFLRYLHYIPMQCPLHEDTVYITYSVCYIETQCSLYVYTVHLEWPYKRALPKFIIVCDKNWCKHEDMTFYNEVKLVRNFPRYTTFHYTELQTFQRPVSGDWWLGLVLFLLSSHCTLLSLCIHQNLQFLLSFVPFFSLRFWFVSSRPAMH